LHAPVRYAFCRDDKFFKNHSFNKIQAEIAQLVEHDLAKVGVAGSSPVFRSFLFVSLPDNRLANIIRPDGGIGRHAGLKILWPVMAVRVQFPLRVQIKPFKILS
jgi:hypothetical protein